MLVHLNQPDVAQRVHNAWLCTMEDGIHTYDIDQRLGATMIDNRGVKGTFGGQPGFTLAQGQ